MSFIVSCGKLVFCLRSAEGLCNIQLHSHLPGSPRKTGCLAKRINGNKIKCAITYLDILQKAWNAANYFHWQLLNGLQNSVKGWFWTCYPWVQSPSVWATQTRIYGIQAMPMPFKLFKIILPQNSIQWCFAKYRHPVPELIGAAFFGCYLANGLAGRQADRP